MVFIETVALFIRVSLEITAVVCLKFLVKDYGMRCIQGSNNEIFKTLMYGLE